MDFTDLLGGTALTSEKQGVCCTTVVAFADEHVVGQVLFKGMPILSNAGICCHFLDRQQLGESKLKRLSLITIDASGV